MARAPFDTTCDLIYGPSGLVPDTVYASDVPCHFVAEDYQIPQLYRLDERVAYITSESLPNQALVSGSSSNPSYNFDYADRIAIPSGSDPLYLVLFNEVVDYDGQPIYTRTHVSLINDISYIEGCGDCEYSPSQWRVTWSGTGYDRPFDGEPFILEYNIGSSPICTWEYTDGSTYYAGLYYDVFWGWRIYADDYAGNGAYYNNVDGWNCDLDNAFDLYSSVGTYPANLTISPY